MNGNNRNSPNFQCCFSATFTRKQHDKILQYCALKKINKTELIRNAVDAFIRSVGIDDENLKRLANVRTPYEEIERNCSSD